MSDDEAFEPRLGRIRARGGQRPRRYLSRILAAANLARDGPASTRPRRAGGARGRAAGVGRLLASRDHLAAVRQRRVIIKSRIVRLAGKGAAGAVAHLRYLQRDGVTRDAAPGALYDAAKDRADGKAFLARSDGDRHQFRFIVSAEDGSDYDDLRPLTRRLMQRVEQDLGTKLDWVAVDHFNTGHPHSHIIVRGKDDRGADLVIARDYLARGMRERAAELVAIDLGPRSDRDIQARLRAEIAQQRLTSIDRALLREADTNRVVVADGGTTFEAALRTGRLNTLATMGLAAPLGARRWRLDISLAETLRTISERGDIIRSMQRAFAARAIDRPVANWQIDRLENASPVIGRLVARGLADEHADRHFIVVDGIDGRTHYVDIGRGDALAPFDEGAIVRVETIAPRVRESDHVVAAVAQANGGVYSIDAHLRHDPLASEAFAATLIRRLEAMRRTTGAVERRGNGDWLIADDHLDRIVAYERARRVDRPVVVAVLSPLPLAHLIEADAATWLDRDAHRVTPRAASGFGAELADALTRRRQWLVAEGLIDELDVGMASRGKLVALLERRDLLNAATALSKDLGVPFAEATDGLRVTGIYRRRLDLASGRFAVIERAHDFTLIPWRAVLEPRLGQSVSGVIRANGIAWSFGRARSGPTIS